ncbi:hypothetical protein DPMN_152842 [Dreissena polymorpha]|uniref:Uncharacterized protein n=1 Tax=Dreissena polymorpha TaxID=45954 RepID=A0A9D4J486_DREPO|nr:hypothetical protein DPMN_152842 [Dreissena polymorpha]
MPQKCFINDLEELLLSTMLSGQINGIYKLAKTPPWGLNKRGTKGSPEVVSHWR